MNNKESVISYIENNPFCTTYAISNFTLINRSEVREVLKDLCVNNKQLIVSYKLVDFVSIRTFRFQGVRKLNAFNRY